MAISESSGALPHAGETNLSRRVALIVAIAFFMQFLDGTIISTSLPQIGASFGVPAVGMSIGITVYLLTTAVFVPVSGWLADRFGAREVFVAAIVVFTLSSLACGLARDLPEFILARAVQGVGGALMTPVGRVLVLRNAAKSDLLRATALITWPALFAPVIGPVLGSFITTYLSWRWNFFLNPPLGILGVGLVLRYVPGSREAGGQPLDWLGFVFASTGLASVLWGFQRVAEPEGGPALTVALIAAGAISSVLAIRHLSRAASPLLDLSTFKIHTFSISTLSAGTYFRIAINATPFLLPLLFQVGFGRSPVEAGLYIFAYFLGNLGMKSITTPLLRRFGFRTVLIVNGLVASLAIAGCAAISPGTPWPLTIALMIVAGLTRSMQFTALATLAFADVPPAQRSSASTLSAILQQVAMVFGIAFAAAALNLSQYLRGGGVPSAMDFRVAFLAIGAIGFVASFQFLALPRDAAAEVSGHAPGPRRRGSNRP
jgi:EmrB/QacA subfamily drug resistance transporter